MDKDNHKKVGILTYHNPDNYGAVLQTLGLVEVLKTMGVEVSVIDYTTAAHLNAYKFFHFNGTLKSIFNMTFGLPNFFRLKRRHRKFVDFRTTHFPLTRRYVEKKDFLSDLPELDAIVTGSDQVFNVCENKELSVYYLPFDRTNIKKIAYAPSFGMSEFTSSVDAKIAKALSDFDKLSCREQKGAHHIQELTGRECSLVVDPVLLVGKDFWARICNRQNEFKKKYILIYDLLGGTYLVNLAKQLNRGKNYKIVCITARKFLKRPYHVDKLIWDASPLDFVGWFMNASYVVTDSFHGSAFATVFCKPLVSLIINERASERLETLLSYLNAKEKLLTKKKILTGIDVNDYVINTNMTMKLEKAIVASQEYLKNAINEI